MDGEVGPEAAVAPKGGVEKRSESVLLMIIKIGVIAFAAALLWIIGIRQGFLVRALLTTLLSQLGQLRSAFQGRLSK